VRSLERFAQGSASAFCWVAEPRRRIRINCHEGTRDPCAHGWAADHAPSGRLRRFASSAEAARVPGIIVENGDVYV
jgi:hypothetical protein